MGAGRTETKEAIFGAVPKSVGEIYLNGKKLNITSPYSAIQQGLGMLTESRRETDFARNFSCKQNISLIPFIKSICLTGIRNMHPACAVRHSDGFPQNLSDNPLIDIISIIPTAF